MSRLLAVLAVLSIAAAPAFAESRCKRVVVGKKQGERRVICEVDTPVVVRAKPPRPGVAIVGEDGKKTVGRPVTTNPLRGLPQQLR